MRKKIRFILSCILVLCALCGCNKPPKDDLPDPTVTPELTITITPKPTNPVLTVAPSGTTELPIYTISGDLSELTAITALLAEGEEITEQAVTDAVVDGLADIGIYVTVNYVQKKDNVVVVDFATDSPPVSQVGASIEGLILDAFGQSLLDNVSECDAVGFSVDGGDYASGHFEFSKDDIYLSR